MADERRTDIHPTIGDVGRLRRRRQSIEEQAAADAAAWWMMRYNALRHDLEIEARKNNHAVHRILRKEIARDTAMRDLYRRGGMRKVADPSLPDDKDITP